MAAAPSQTHKEYELIRRMREARRANRKPPVDEASDALTIKKREQFYSRNFHLIIEAWQGKHSSHIREFFFTGVFPEIHEDEDLEARPRDVLFGLWAFWNVMNNRFAEKIVQLDNKPYVRGFDFTQTPVTDTKTFFTLDPRHPVLLTTKVEGIVLRTLPVLTEDTILYRGIEKPSRYQKFTEGADKNFYLNNTISNWTSNPAIAKKFAVKNYANFASYDPTIIATLFPKGTRFYWTGHGGDQAYEAEFIIPGGRFRRVEDSKTFAKKELQQYQKYRPRDADTKERVGKVVLLEYEPLDQQFPWPGTSDPIEFSRSMERGYMEYESGSMGLARELLDEDDDEITIGYVSKEFEQRAKELRLFQYRPGRVDISQWQTIRAYYHTLWEHLNSGKHPIFPFSTTGVTPWSETIVDRIERIFRREIVQVKLKEANEQKTESDVYDDPDKTKIVEAYNPVIPKPSPTSFPPSMPLAYIVQLAVSSLEQEGLDNAQLLNIDPWRLPVVREPVTAQSAEYYYKFSFDALVQYQRKLFPDRLQALLEDRVIWLVTAGDLPVARQLRSLLDGRTMKRLSLEEKATMSAAEIDVYQARYLQHIRYVQYLRSSKSGKNAKFLVDLARQQLAQREEQLRLHESARAQAQSLAQAQAQPQAESQRQSLPTVGVQNMQF